MTAMTYRRLPGMLSTLADRVLSPSPARQALAQQRYDDLAAYLQQHMSAKLDCRVWVYPQGSYRLGTTLVNPVTNEFDVDIVVAYDASRTDMSKSEIVQQMHGWLVRYYQQRQGHGDLEPVDYRKGARAFTLCYADDFHMDILPVVLEKPTPPTAPGQPSWLPDRDLFHWQPTNPRGFAEYFDAAAQAERVALAKRADVQVDELPRLGLKTELQHAVMLFKRHRDEMFPDDEDKVAPHSSLITALATAAYRNAQALDPRAQDVARGLAAELNYRNGQLWVPNPTWKREGVELENYADRYAGRPDKLRHLKRWIDALNQDLTSFTDARDQRTRASIISKAFGEGLGERTAAEHGKFVADAAAKHGMGAGSSGLLLGAANAPRPIFHGQVR